MKYRVCILARDSYLKRKLELILSEHAIFTNQADADIVFADSHLSVSGARLVTVGKGVDCTLRIPFSDAQVLNLLPSDEQTRHGIAVIGGRILLGERDIKLTELERGLFMKLYDARGEFVSRDELFSVFADGSSESMLNVYIHYLREKLEGDGTRVIISSRKHGYKIDEKFFLQGGCDA